LESCFDSHITSGFNLNIGDCKKQVKISQYRCALFYGQEVTFLTDGFQFNCMGVFKGDLSSKQVAKPAFTSLLTFTNYLNKFLKGKSKSIVDEF
jgi:hypothetical protein